MRELPALESLSKAFARKDLIVLGITRDDAKTARATLQRTGVTFRNLIDENEVAFRKLQVRGIPRSFIIDKAGVVRADLPGAMSEAEFRAELRKVGIQ